MNQAPLSPASALVAHIESLVTDRRILVIGNAERSIAEHLLERGARLVQLLDPDPRRVAQAAAHNGERRLTLAQLTDSALRDGSYDCILVEDLSLADDLTKLVSGIQRSMSNRGVAIFCANNSENSTGLLGATRGTADYDALCEATEDCFESVLMLGQSPFVGYSVVQFDLDHAPEPSLDNAYLNEAGETPDFYIAVCGTEETINALKLDEMSIVQLPAARFVENSEQIHREKELRAARRVETLEAELGTLRGRSSGKEVEKLTAELEQRDSWIRQLESRAEKSDARADDAEAEVEELENEVELSLQVLRKEREAWAKERSKIEKDRTPLAEGNQKLTRENQKLASENQKLTSENQKLASENQKLANDNQKLTKKLEEARLAADEVQHQSAGREALEQELNKLDQSKRALESSLNDKSRALERLEKRLAEQEKEIDDLHDQLDDTEARLHKAKSSVIDSESPTLKEVARDLRGLEDQLKRRGQRVAELEGQLGKLETYAKTLAAELVSRPSAGAVTPSTSEEIAALARALAEREADLVAAEWTIGQLKQTTLKD